MKAKNATIMDLNNGSIQIHTGKDGTWITLKSSHGKNISFQPTVELARLKGDSIMGMALREWLEDRQGEYERS